MTDRNIRPDRVIIADRVHTVDSDNSTAEAVAISGRTIIAVGSRADVHSWDLSRAEVIELPGATLTPGFVDAHIHPIYGAEQLWRAVDLSGLDTLDELRTAIAAHAETLGPGGWIIGNRMPFHAFIGKTIRNEHFADIFGDLPAFLTFFDGHASIASEEALRLAGITGPIDFGNNSSIDVDEQGKPTGYLIESNAQSLVRDVIPPLTLESRKVAVLAALEKFAASGYTGLHAMDFSETDIEVLQALEADGDLPVRVRISPMWRSMDDWETTFKRFVDLQGLGGRRWKVEGVKMMLDGTVENGSAWLYESDIDGGGTLPYWVPSELYIRSVHALIENGIPVVTHAIGDRGVDFVLDVLESAPDLGRELVHRVEHVETIPDSTVPRFKQLGVAASMQPMHVLSTSADESDLWSIKLGKGTDRAHAKWRIKDIWETGAIVALGSDWPVEEFDARQVFATNITRKRPFTDQAPIRPDQGLDAEITLRQFTQQVWASIGEPWNGMIKPGAIADLAAFAGDPLTLDPEEFAATPVVLTVVGGRVAHRGSLQSDSLIHRTQSLHKTDNHS
ncbi:amidohydrolase [Agromyces italicus]|uniref:amidohydrolase n=1 Tax=Agromyces italicus TaxID=279572 RepID=UPI0003B7195D|nr:amidohydrolase [Agromyces italicus]